MSLSPVTVFRRALTSRIILRSMSSGGDGNKVNEKLTKKGAADENQYFRQLEREQLSALKDHHNDEIKEHEADIKRLQEKIEQHKKRLEQLQKHD